MDLEFDFHHITSKDPLDRVLIGYDLLADVEALEMVQTMFLLSITTWTTKFKLLNKLIGPSPKTPVDKAPKLELKLSPII